VTENVFSALAYAKQNVQMHQIITAVALLIATAVLFYFAYSDYSTSESFTTTGVVCAAGGVLAVFSLVALSMNRKRTGESALESNMADEEAQHYKAEDSNNGSRKRWWRNL
jgi:hypothetical protein